MKNKSPLFEIDTSSKHDEGVFKRTQEILSKRKSEARRKFLTWLTVPALATASAALYIRTQKESDSESAASDMAALLDIEDETEVELDMIAELEVLEELEDLEDWDESIDT